MDNPCDTCRRQDSCDHFQRCKRWCTWFAGVWQKMKEAYEIRCPDIADRLPTAGSAIDGQAG